MTRKAFDLEFELLNPIQVPKQVSQAMAPRLSHLEGSTLALLDNTKINSDRLLEYIAKVLQDEYGIGRVIHQRKLHPSFPATDALYDELAITVDAVVTGIGD
jgi:hypothetical protein